jgi:glycerate kinase
MKIVIAPDSFKESLTSLEVATALERGIRRVLPRARIVKLPLADGGEGTIEALVAATGGRVPRCTVSDPLGEPVRARYGLLGDGVTAVIEAAEASGLERLAPAARNPLNTTSYGTGELIAAALDRGVRSIIVGIGGSATVDGGAGAAQALGVRFLDRRGRAITRPLSGGRLDRVAGIDLDGRDPRLAHTRIRIACDVDNPLCGPRGAAAVFGPQKGATPAMVRALDANLRRFARVIEDQLGIRIRDRRGAGAAGGLGAGLAAFAGGRLEPGIDLLARMTGLARHLREADLVITGEGRIDFQTAFGKTPAGVARIARRARLPVVAVGGALGADARRVFGCGIDALEGAIARDMTLAQALADAERNLADAGERLIRLLLVGRRIERRHRRR